MTIHLMTWRWEKTPHNEFFEMLERMEHKNIQRIEPKTIFESINILFFFLVRVLWTWQIPQFRWHSMRLHTLWNWHAHARYDAPLGLLSPYKTPRMGGTNLQPIESKAALKRKCVGGECQSQLNYNANSLFISMKPFNKLEKTNTHRQPKKSQLKSSNGQAAKYKKKEHNNEPTQANTHTKMTSYQLMAIKTD